MERSAPHGRQLWQRDAYVLDSVIYFGLPGLIKRVHDSMSEVTGENHSFL